MATKKVTPKVDSILINVEVPVKPFASLSEVYEAYHNLGSDAEEIAKGECDPAKCDDWERVQALLFISRLLAWDAKPQLEALKNKIAASLGKDI